MTARAKPPFRADHVGSFLRPSALLDARERFQARQRSKERSCARSRTPRSATSCASRRTWACRGITDGEFRRTYFHIDFLEQLSGVETKGGIAASSTARRATSTSRRRSCR